MRRFLYGCLIRLHPRPFRQRFGDEMMSIFDEAGSDARLFADACLSLARQWTLRPGAWEQPATAGPAPRTLDDVPLFYTAETSLPRPGALFNGLVLSVAVFSAVSFAIGHWTTGPAPALPTVYGASPQGGLLFNRAEAPVAAPAVNPANAAPVAAPYFAPAPVLPMKPPTAEAVAAAYFPSVPALAALDTDHDGAISAAEIAHAAAALRKLERRDFRPAIAPPAGAPVTRVVTNRVAASRPVCVSFDAVLAAIDTNHDGILSPQELKRAPAALKALDKNGDGILSAEEVLPETVCAP